MEVNAFYGIKSVQLSPAPHEVTQLQKMLCYTLSTVRGSLGDDFYDTIKEMEDALKDLDLDEETPR